MQYVGSLNLLCHYSSDQTGIYTAMQYVGSLNLLCHYSSDQTGIYTAMQYVGSLNLLCHYSSDQTGIYTAMQYVGSLNLLCHYSSDQTDISTVSNDYVGSLNFLSLQMRSDWHLWSDAICRFTEFPVITVQITVVSMQGHASLIHMNRCVMLV